MQVYKAHSLVATAASNDSDIVVSLKFSLDEYFSVFSKTLPKFFEKVFKKKFSTSVGEKCPKNTGTLQNQKRISTLK